MGFDVNSFMRKTIENIISPMVNGDFVLRYMSTYVSIRKDNSAMLSVENTVFPI